ncbi:MAG: hypothetical protein HY260_14290 [Chloroflexi bacterium]|nr:hypothetical protein [Chloroflexota bacterium]
MNFTPHVSRPSPLSFLLAVLLAACSTVATPTPTASRPPTQTPASATLTPITRTVAPVTVTVSVSPIIAANLGDRVLGPATVSVEAPGASRVEVYVWPVDGPFSNAALSDPKLIGVDDDAADGFAVPWAADEPYFAVKVFATAYRGADGKSQSSEPIWVLLDWRHGTATAEAVSTATLASLTLRLPAHAVAQITFKP